MSGILFKMLNSIVVVINTRPDHPSEPPRILQVVPVANFEDSKPIATSLETNQVQVALHGGKYLMKKQKAIFLYHCQPAAVSHSFELGLNTLEIVIEHPFLFRNGNRIFSGILMERMSFRGIRNMPVHPHKQRALLQYQPLHLLPMKTPNHQIGPRRIQKTRNQVDPIKTPYSVAKCSSSTFCTRLIPLIWLAS